MTYVINYKNSSPVVQSSILVQQSSPVNRDYPSLVASNFLISSNKFMIMHMKANDDPTSFRLHIKRCMVTWMPVMIIHFTHKLYKI